LGNDGRFRRAILDRSREAASATISDALLPRFAEFSNGSRIKQKAMGGSSLESRDWSSARPA
jgi:hypothetical protein